LSLALFVVHLPLTPAFGVDIVYRRGVRRTHVSTVTENTEPYCSIVHTARSL
jgi:hypothetical protein